MHSGGTMSGFEILTVSMSMDSASPTDHHGHTSGRLLVGSLMELVVMISLFPAVLAMKVTATPLLRLLEMTISVRA